MSNEVKTTAKRGRPVVAGSKRQAVLAMRDAKRNSGIEIKRGRPRKQVTVEVDVVAKTKTVKSKAQKQAALATKVADVNEAALPLDELSVWSKIN